MPEYDLVLYLKTKQRLQGFGFFEPQCSTVNRYLALFAIRCFAFKSLIQNKRSIQPRKINRRCTDKTYSMEQSRHFTYLTPSSVTHGVNVFITFLIVHFVFNDLNVLIFFKFFCIYARRSATKLHLGRFRRFCRALPS